MKNNLIITYTIVALAIIIIVVFILSTKKDTVTYAYMPTVAVDLPSIMASENTENNIKFIPFITGMETVQALLGGNVNFATMAPFPFLLASKNRDDLRIVANFTKAYSMGILTRNSSNINTFSDFEGKTVGLPIGTTAQFLFESLITKNSIDKSNINIINLPPPQLQGALKRGDLDAIVVWQPFLEKARQLNLGRFSYLKNSQNEFRVLFLLVSTEKYLSKNPDKTKKVIESLIDSEKEINNLILQKSYREMSDKMELDEAIWETILPLFDFQVSLNNDIIDTLDLETKWAVNVNIINEDILERDWREFIDASFLKEIDLNRVNLKS